MADERAGTREPDVRRKYSWLELLRTFLIALDPFKLLIAAAGILVTAFGWWLFSVIYFGMWSEPKGYNDINPKAREAEIEERKKALIKDGVEEVAADEKANSDYLSDGRRFELMRGLGGPGGRYRTMPWFQDRGRNPYLVATDVVSGSRADQSAAVGSVIKQAPVILEPLVKFLGPVYLLFDPNAGFWIRAYLFIIIVWMLAVWAFFGGIITRMAIVQMAGKEGGGLRESLKFAKDRYVSYLSSPLVPIALIFAVVVGLMIFGLFALIPIVGDIFVSGLLWWVPLGAGFVMALLVVGLVGYPLMYTTLSAEGSDTFDALSRSYNYVYESPWSYIWYGFISVCYGVVVVLFVVFMSSLMVYLGKWGVSQTPLTQTTNRSPEFLFIYSPTSFGWRELMLQGSPIEITPDKNKAGVTKEGKQIEQTPGYWFVKPEVAVPYMNDYHWYNYAGAGMVSFWLTLFFMVMLGFSYSYFWTASSMIYLLMRKKVDEVEIDEIYTEEEEADEPIAPVKPAAPTATGPSTILIDAPTLRVAPVTAAPPVPPTPPAVTPTPEPPTPPAVTPTPEPPIPPAPPPAAEIPDETPAPPPKEPPPSTTP